MNVKGSSLQGASPRPPGAGHTPEPGAGEDVVSDGVPEEVPWPAGQDAPVAAVGDVDGTVGRALAVEGDGADIPLPDADAALTRDDGGDGDAPGDGTG